MLRIEKVFEAAGINEELESYNPLISRRPQLEGHLYGGVSRPCGAGTPPGKN